MKRVLNRRHVLRGAMAGGTLALGLPLLDCMLNENGEAFADTGKPLPTRFATWYWPHGLGEGDWVPKSAGADYELPAQCSDLKPMQKKLNFFSGGQVFRDGQPNVTHFTGVQGLMTGKVTKAGEYFGSIDTLIAENIGAQSRFRTLQVSCSGEPKASWSGTSDGGVQAAEVSPYALYMRIFGPEYRDPNAASFTPDPQVILRRSVLSGITDARNDMMRKWGAADRAKLDRYFTSVRDLEQKLDVQLQKPEPLAACTKPPEVANDDGHILTLTREALVRHDLFTQLFAHAMACDQTRVVNLAISISFSGLRRDGDPVSHHTWTHEEPPDPKTGIQPTCGWFQQAYMKALHDFAAAFDNIQEGDKTLLDRMIVFAFTDHGKPRFHSLQDMPVITLGSGNGRLKTGLHVPRQGEAVTRVSYTIQQALGVPVSAWGTGSNRITSPIPGILV
jgi:hypothetical protein